MNRLAIVVVVVVAMGLLFVIQDLYAQEEEECILGPSSWTDSMKSTNPEGYQDAIRIDEIKEYIDENKDDLYIPDYYDDDFILCGVAMSVQQEEKKQGKVFDEGLLESYVFIEVKRMEKDGMDKIMSEPEKYLQ
jgi:hypothetical protein